ncbi:uncharacterized protein [Henckelia pumila]|uniref:uncharacterized protein n=1 Tax=Henckelia pumila TaxID=405737 RepID=UPI003C6E7BD5
MAAQGDLQGLAGGYSVGKETELAITITENISADMLNISADKTVKRGRGRPPKRNKSVPPTLTRESVPNLDSSQPSNISQSVIEPKRQLDLEWSSKKFGISEVISNCSSKIWLYFSHQVSVFVVVDHEQFLHVKLSSSLFPIDIYVSVVYAKCNGTERRDLWDGLLDCIPRDGCPWVVGGDFNVINDPTEHSRGVVNCPGAMAEFSDFIISAGLSDVGFVGAKDVFGNVHDNVKVLDLKASQAQVDFDDNPSEENRTALSLAPANLAMGLSVEEAFCKQKASAKWIMEGEKNTALFHNMVNQRRVRNKIFRIWDDGTALDNPSQISEFGVRFFESLLTGESSAPSEPKFDNIPVLVTKEDNRFLLAPFSEKEIHDCVL